SGGERYAIPFFCDSNIDWPVAAVPTTVGPDKPPKYPTTWYTDYMVWYQKRNYDAVYDTSQQQAAEGARPRRPSPLSTLGPTSRMSPVRRTMRPPSCGLR